MAETTVAVEDLLVTDATTPMAMVVGSRAETTNSAITNTKVTVVGPTITIAALAVSSITTLEMALLHSVDTTRVHISSGHPPLDMLLADRHSNNPSVHLVVIRHRPKLLLCLALITITEHSDTVILCSHSSLVYDIVISAATVGFFLFM